jgi:hypothetical protein
VKTPITKDPRLDQDVQQTPERIPIPSDTDSGSIIGIDLGISLYGFSMVLAMNEQIEVYRSRDIRYSSVMSNS